MPWESEAKPPAITLDDNIPLPPGTYHATIEPIPTPGPPPTARVSNFRPCQQYKTWPNRAHAEIALSYLVKHEREKWRFAIEPAPTPGRFVIAAFDDWGQAKGWI